MSRDTIKEEDIILNANDWFYKGEGACNIVVYYNPTSSSSPAPPLNHQLQGKVLRLKKKVSSKPLTTTQDDDKDYNFVQNIMEPLIGSKYVNSGIKVSINKQFIKDLNDKIFDKRPQHRIHHQLDDDMTFGILIRDITIIPNHSIDDSPSICVEIKPKCGFITSSKYISPENAQLKHHVCRYCMHQLTKLKDGSIDSTSKYCPMDLYSLDRSKQLRALDSLIECPQNNLKVFKDGVLYFTGQLGGGHGGSNTTSGNNQLGNGEEDNEVLSTTSTTDIRSLNSLFKVDSQQQRQQQLHHPLSNILVNILEKEKELLMNLAKVQSEYDPYDIETIYYLYCKLHNTKYQPHGKDGDDERDNQEIQNRFSDFSKLTNMEIETIISRYLIATTAKDCSIMITFNLPSQGDGDNGDNIKYIVGVVDLDPKKESSIPLYFKNDQAIVLVYRNELANNDNCNTTVKSTCI